MSIQIKYDYLEQAFPDMLEGIGMLIQKAKLACRFGSITLSDEDNERLLNAKDLCELKIIEIWENRENEAQFKGLCSVYLDIATLLPIRWDSDLLIYEQLKLISLGYIGEHWHFVKQYLKANSRGFDAIQSNDSWSHRILVISFKAIINLVNKDSWNEINHSVELINQLRREQRDLENSFLNQLNEESRPYGAAELISLYHFAKCVDILGSYLMEGRPLEPEDKLKYHVGISTEYAQMSGNISLVLFYKFFEGFSIKMVRNTIWYTTRGINNWVTRFNQYVSHREKNGLFELLYPQKESITKGELLNPAHRAVVVNLPTSSGKTLIAEYRILQALNQFREQGGWVAYVVPTRALVNQIYIQLKKDLSGIGVTVERASGAIDLDGFEQHLVEDNGNRTDFDILVTTYEKMNLLVRQGLGTTDERPLVLTVVDEAHNIEKKNRGLNLEFLLSTIKNDCAESNFLLMTPDIPNSEEVVKWLAGDRGKVIDLELEWWQPNERIIGAIEVVGSRRDYDYVLRTLHTDKGTYEIGDSILLKSLQESAHTASFARGSKVKIASQVASDILSLDAPTIVLAYSPNDTYKIADFLYESVGRDMEFDEDVDLVVKLVKNEMGDDFPLAKYLERRIAVHSAGLPDEIRFLIEDLMSNEKLQALVATTTIAQGINFPVSSIIIGAYHYPYSGAMPVRDFWNLAGRVGRAGQNSMGWVGIAVKNNDDLLTVSQYVKEASGDLHSQLSDAIDNVLMHDESDFRKWLYKDERWSAILQYISHLRRQTDEQDAFIASLELKLQSTFGYNQLTDAKKNFLRSNLRRYVSTLSLVEAKSSDETGFSSVSVRQMIGRLSEFNLRPQDWQKNQLFYENNMTMQGLVGIMLNTYEIKTSLKELNDGAEPLDRSSIARMISSWVNGSDIATIAKESYPNIDTTLAIQKTTKSLYGIIANSATWGLAALQKMPTSGINWDGLSEIEKKKMSNLPAYMHYGVNTDEGVLMRKNNVPRSVSNRLGGLFSDAVEGNIFSQTTDSVNDWIGQQTNETWHRIRPRGSKLTGEEYRLVWKKLNGE